MGKRRIAKDYLPHFNEEQLVSDIQEKKALPDMIFKFNIFKAHQEMIDAKAKMMYNKRANFMMGNSNKVIMAEPGDLHNLANKIDSLFCMLKYMILVKIGEHKQRKNQGRYLRDSKIYELLDNLNAGRIRRYCEPDLLVMMDFLIQYMHELNFTNLLKSEIDPFTELEESF